MSDLQTAYYITALVFMGVMFVVLIGLFVAVLVIRAKVNAIHARIEEKLEQVTDLAEKGGAVISGIKKVAQKAKR